MIGQRHRQRMQRDGPVRIEHALGLSGGARGVTHRGRVLFGEVWVSLWAAGFRKESFKRLATFRDFPTAMVHHEHPFEADVRTDLLEDFKQYFIHNQKTVLSMVD